MSHASSAPARHSSSPSPCPRCTTLNLKTSRLQEMIDWYGLVVGMRPRTRRLAGAWLSNDAANHRLALLWTPRIEDDPDKLTTRHPSHRVRIRDPRRPARDLRPAQDAGILPHCVLDHG